jgi:hypothetical protein
MTKGEEIRRLVKKVENQVEEGILPDGKCLFDPLRVRLALELVLSVLEQNHPAKTKESN